MFHYAFLVFLLIFECDTLNAVDISDTPDPTFALTPHSTTGTTDPALVPMDPSSAPPTDLTATPTNGTTAAPPDPTTVPTNGTTAAPPMPTTAPANVTTAAPPVPTTTSANATTAAPPVPTTAPANATTAAPPVPTTAPANATTAAPPVPTTAPANATTAAPPVPTTAPANATTAAPPVPTTTPTNVTTTAPPVPTTVPANATTAAPPVPTTAAPSPMPPPSVGNYSVRNDNSTACLMATLGLQIGYKDGELFKNVNLDPNTTTAAGKCGVDESDASLLLTFHNSSITFTFREEGEKFRLHLVNVTLNLGATGTFNAGNANLSLWEASVGSSYMCRRDQTYNITDTLILRTKDLQVQPYKVQNNHFSTAHDCAMDDTSILIPIVVGAALAGLILIVMIAYAIGRRKTYVGYQTL